MIMVYFQKGNLSQVIKLAYKYHIRAKFSTFLKRKKKGEKIQKIIYFKFFCFEVGMWKALMSYSFETSLVIKPDWRIHTKICMVDCVMLYDSNKDLVIFMFQAMLQQTK